MPVREIGPEIVRGTICRDRWRAQLLVACSDRIPLGGRAPLLVRIRWREEGNGDPVPEEARRVVLRLRRSSAASSGAILFDGPDGEQTRELAGAGEYLLDLYGSARTAASEPDVLLEIELDGEVQERIPLSVGPSARRLWIRSGGAPLPDLIPPGQPIPCSAWIDPATPGTIRWIALGGGGLELQESAPEITARIIGHLGATGERAICALFSAEDGEVIMSAHRLAVHRDAVPVAALDLGTLVRPTVLCAGWSRALAATGGEVELLAVIRGGSFGQRVSFEIVARNDLAAHSLERIEVPLGVDALVRVPWRIPDAFPGEELSALGFRVSIADHLVHSADADSLPEAPGVSLFGELRLSAPLRLLLTDSRGLPAAGVAFQLRTTGGALVPGGGGRSASNGEITIPALAAERYTLVLEDALVFDAHESPVGALLPSPENTIFTFVDVRPEGAGGG